MRTDDCAVAGRSRDPHVSCVDEHTNYRCDRVPDFQMQVLSGERCAETLMTGGPGCMQKLRIVSARRRNDFRNEQVQLCERDDAKVSLFSPAELDVLNPGLVDQGITGKIPVWWMPQERKVQNMMVRTSSR